MALNRSVFDRYIRKMKSSKPLVIVLIVVLSVLAIGRIVKELNELGKFSDWTSADSEGGIELPAYVITDSAFRTEEEALERLAELRRQAEADNYFRARFANFDYFWIPDFPYLSNREFYLVYIGPYTSREDAYAALCDYKRRYNSGSYGVLLSDKPGTDKFYCSE